jgi:hypothetical protein
MTNRDAMRSVMARVPAAEVKFVDPVLQMFFDDERAGLCDIEVKRLGPIVPPEGVQHHIIVRYLDPELEMIKTLSI